MVEIRREHYLETLRRFSETPSIVAVVGLRRVGKSVLMGQFADEARSSQHLVVLDEVQQIEQWERAVASLNAEPHTRLIISGSNASMFSG